MTENANSTSNRITNVFVASAIAILAITSLLKLATLIQGRPFLITSAPIFPELSWRELLSVAVILETGTAILAWWLRRSPGALWVILWLTVLFGIFRSMLLIVRYEGPCNCLGRPEWLPFSSRVENIVSLSALAYLFVGSITLLLLSGRVGSFRSVALGRLLPLVIIFLTQSAWGEGQGFLISGEQVVFAEYKGLEQVAQKTTFEVASSGADWRMTITYPQTKNVDSHAFVSGVPYLTSVALNRTNIAGTVMVKGSDMLEGMTEAARVIFFTFLNTREPTNALGTPTSQLAPFVMPRFPLMHAYRCDIQRSDEHPYLPKNITWTLDFKQIDRVPDAVIQNYFGTVRRGRKFTKDFSETQREPATFTAGPFTNLNGLHVPLHSKLVHRYFDRDAKSGLRRFETSAHAVVPLVETDLKPLLSPDSRVIHIINGKPYLYYSTNGTWLAGNVAKEIGQVMNTASEEPDQIRTGRRVSTGRLLMAVCLIFAAPALGYFLVQQQRKHHKQKTIL